MTLTEGKNREVRLVLEHLGLKVNRLLRVGFTVRQRSGGVVELAERGVAVCQADARDLALVVGKQRDGVGVAAKRPERHAARRALREGVRQPVPQLLERVH